MAPFHAKINPDHFGADINILFIITYLSYYFRGGAKKQPVPWPGGPGYNGAYAYSIGMSENPHVSHQFCAPNVCTFYIYFIFVHEMFTLFMST